MSKLLYAGIRRYLKSIIFWLAVIATAAIAVDFGYWTRNKYIDDVYFLAEFIVLAILFTWLVGREFDEGVFRNKMICGHTKGTIFFSELILSEINCIFLFLIFSGIFVAFNGYIFSNIPANVLIRIFIGCLLSNMAFTAIFVTISCLIPHRAIIAVINILLIFGITFVSNDIDYSLSNEKYNIVYDTETKETVDEYGEYIEEEIEIPGTERKVINPNYVDGWKRSVLKVAYRIMPISYIEDSVMRTYNCFGYNDEYRNNGLTYEDDPNTKFSITREDNKALSVDLVYMPILTLVITAAGYALFRRRDFK